MTEKYLEEDGKFLKFLKKYSTIIIIMLSLLGCTLVYSYNKNMGIFEFILVLSWFIPLIIKKYLKND